MVFLSEKYVRKLRKMKNERNALIKKHINNLPLARQFALTAFKRQMFGGKTRHVRHPIIGLVSTLRCNCTIIY